MADQNRLREYLQQAEQQYAVYLEGLRLGGRWAANVASLDELESLELFKRHLDEDCRWELWFDQHPPEFTVADRWHFAVIDPNGCGVRCRLPVKPNCDAALQFWTTYGGAEPKVVPGEFVRGFSDGALELFQRFNSSEA